MAVPELSSGISPPTFLTAYELFKPSNSELRQVPSYYRGCWHEVSRTFLFGYSHFLPRRKSFRPKGLLHSRGIAASGFPPLCKTPYCCLPQEFGPCLSPNVADHPLRSAIDQSLGRPLPHQQTNQVQAHPSAHKAFSVKTYEVLAQVSSCYSSPMGRYLHVTHPSATKYCYFVRLACIRRAASVRSEP